MMPKGVANLENLFDLKERFKGSNKQGFHVPCTKL
jgi:hypothetical protein